MRVLIVRHGESENNELTDRVTEQGLTGDAWWQEVMRLQHSDPRLTAKGEREAELLADFYAPIFAESGYGCRIFTSPLLRCCQTTWPLASRHMAAPAASGRTTVTCHPEIFEVGGPHVVKELASGELIFDDDNAGECMTAADIEARFPGYNTDRLPSKGQWYVKGPETIWAEREMRAAERARRVVAWIRHDQKLHDKIGSTAVMVMVMHGGFINLLLQELLGGVHGFPNTATALLDISRSGKVHAHWVGDTAHLEEGGETGDSRQQAVLAAFLGARRKL